MGNICKKSIVEALIFASPGPVAASRIMSIIEFDDREEIERLIDRLNEEYNRSGRAFGIRRIAGGYQFFTVPEYAPYIGELHTDKLPIRLTNAMLEALSIIALRQPVTKPVIDKIRGADSSGSVHSLLEQGLVTIRGRKKSPGRPFLYGTTNEFLKYFGLQKLDDLPDENELGELFSDERE